MSSGQRKKGKGSSIQINSNRDLWKGTRHEWKGKRGSKGLDVENSTPGSERRGVGAKKKKMRKRHSNKGGTLVVSQKSQPDEGGRRVV